VKQRCAHGMIRSPYFLLPLQDAELQNKEVVVALPQPILDEGGTSAPTLA
jgi:hypothetical protein